MKHLTEHLWPVGGGLLRGVRRQPPQTRPV